MQLMRAVSAAVAACLAAAVFASPSMGVDPEVLTRAILLETNRERAEHGFPALRADPRLARAAAGHTRFLAMIGTLQHESPLPGFRTVHDRIRAAGLETRSVGENLALTTLRPMMIRERADETGSLEAELTGPKALDVDATATMVVRQWMESPRHRSNLLNPVFTHLGCAVQTSIGPHSGMLLYSTQVFAGL